jgi:hypothetical protein
MSNENSPISRRNAALANLRKQNVEDYEDEFDSQDDELDVDSVLEGKYKDAFAEDSEDQEDLESQAEEVVETAPVVTKHKIKVNGVEKEFTTEELIRKASLVDSAEEYQRQAKQAYEFAQQQIKQPSQDVAKSVDEEIDYASIVDAIQMGDKTEAINAIRQLVGTKNTTPSVEVVSQVVDQKISFQNAVDKFKTEYNDLFEDPVLANMVIAEDQRLLNSGDTRPYIERYTDIGNQVRNWRDSIVERTTGSKPVKKAETLATKQERKLNAPQYPAKKAAVVESAENGNYRNGEPSADERQASLAKKAQARGLQFSPTSRFN